MANTKPIQVAIDPDDYHAQHVGRTSDGRQFFLTTPFVAKRGASPGREFIAFYVFDAKGHLISAEIDDLGPREGMDREASEALTEQRLGSLGATSTERIKIRPFSVERFGVEFGLVARDPEEAGDSWAVEAQPGNYMAFFEPWDSGEYDT